MSVRIPGLVAIALSLAPAAPATAQAWPPSWSPAPDWTLSAGASVQYDVLHADAGEDSLRHDGFRRQRLAVNLEAPRGVSAKVEYDTAAGAWTDAYLRLPLGKGIRLRIGQGRTPMGLETLTSHRHLSLLERAPLTSLVPGRALGAQVQWTAGQGTLAVAVLEGTLNPERRGTGVFARGTRQWRSGDAAEDDRFHFGLSAGSERGDGPLRLRARPDVNGLPLVLADSGVLPEADRIDRLALEGAWDRGPFNLQAEHLWLRARLADATRAADASYLTASWRPTGESRPYRNGQFESPSAGGRWGALEVSVRASRLAVEDASGARRSGHSYALATGWQVVPGVRITAQVGRSHGQAGGNDLIHGLRVHGWF